MEVQLQFRHTLKSTLFGLDAVYMACNLKQSQQESMEVSLGGRNTTKGVGLTLRAVGAESCQGTSTQGKLASGCFREGQGSYGLP